VLAILVTGVVLITASLNVFYRDVSHLLDVGLRVWLLLTPITYARSAVPAQFRTAYNLNPLVGLFDFARAALLGNAAPDFTALLYPLAAGLALLLAGVLVFRSTEPYFAETV
jgi:ABC-type polysaccharide/polyol phosphate export permease